MFVTVPLCMIPGVILWFTPVNVFICFLFCFTLLSCECFFRMCVLHTYVFYECMYTCMHVRRCVCAPVCMCVPCMRAHAVCVCMYVCVYLYKPICMNVYTFTYVCIYVCAYVLIYMCVLVRMCVTFVCIYAYVYVCTCVYFRMFVSNYLCACRRYVCIFCL